MCNTPKISVIVPVYNSEKYLYKALNSLVNQVFSDFEVIIIDDGSTDCSINIINQFCKKYSKFNCISISNRGVSEARNIGIKVAKGEYLAFMDSDDFVSPDFLNVLYNAIRVNNADIACCNYYLHWTKSNISVRSPFALGSKKTINADKLLNMMIKDVRIHFYLWNKLWKKSLFTDNNIMLPNMCFEDIVVSTRLFYNAKIVSVTSMPLYYYSQHNDSLGNFITMKKFNDYLLAFASIRNFLETKNDYKKYSLSYSLLGLRIIITNIKLLFYIHIKDKNFSNIMKEFIRSLKQISYLLSNKFKANNKIENFLNMVDNTEKCMY